MSLPCLFSWYWQVPPATCRSVLQCAESHLQKIGIELMGLELVQLPDIRSHTKETKIVFTELVDNNSAAQAINKLGCMPAIEMAHWQWRAISKLKCLCTQRLECFTISCLECLCAKDLQCNQLPNACTMFPCQRTISCVICSHWTWPDTVSNDQVLIPFV
jgi:hypothetical protein